MNAQRIRNFLLRLPKPSRIRMMGDGEPEEITVGRTSYSKHAETIAAMRPETVQCLDSEGKLLRALDLTSEEANRSEAAAIPKGIESDPQALMLTHFANLLHRAYEHSTDVAFTKMVDLMERLGDRSEAIEARLERTEAANRRLLQDQADDAMERAEEKAAEAANGGGDLAQNILGSFLAGGQVQTTPSHTTNGAGKSHTKKAD